MLRLGLLARELFLRRGGQRLTDEHRAEYGGRSEREYDPPGTHGEVRPPSPRDTLVLRRDNLPPPLIGSFSAWHETQRIAALRRIVATVMPVAGRGAAWLAR